MSRRTLLSTEQRDRLFAVPTDPAEMARHYVLSNENLALVRSKRRGMNRLGFAVQLCLLRYPGQGFGPGDHPPEAMITFVVDQVGVPLHPFAHRQPGRRQAGAARRGPRRRHEPGPVAHGRCLAEADVPSRWDTTAVRLTRSRGILILMQIYLFRSAKDGEVLGYTSDQMGANLPAEFAPWEGKGRALQTGQAYAGLGESDAVLDAIARDGFYVARATTIVARSGPLPQPE